MTFGKTIGLAVLGVAIAFGPASAQEKKWETVKIGTEGAFAPWNLTNASGQIEGFEIDLANDLCARMKVKCEIVAQDWDGIIPALTVKKYDAIMAGMSITDERLEKIAFSRPYAQLSNGFLVAKDSELAKMPGAGQKFDLTNDAANAEKMIEQIKPFFKGKSIGVQVSTTHTNFANKYLKDVAKEIKGYGSTEAHDLDLLAERIDVVTTEITTLRSTLDKPEFKDNFMIAGPGFVGGPIGQGIGIGLRKEDVNLQKMFNDAINAAIADGTVKKLSEKWFNKLDVTPAK